MHRIEAYIRLGLIFVVIISILYLPILFKLKKKGISPTRQVSYIGLVCSIFLIVFATMLFMLISFDSTHTLNIIPFNWNEIGLYQFVVEKISNILLFIPFGFFVPAVYKSKRNIWKTMIIVFLTTFGIEFLQYFMGRSADIDDVITNILGTIIGYYIACWFTKAFTGRVLENSKQSDFNLICGSVVIIMFFFQPFISNLLWKMVL